MANLTQFLYTALCVIVNICHLSQSFPTISEISSNTEASQDSYILSALKLRSKREVLPPPPPPPLGAVNPEVAAHYARLVPRTYAYVRIPTSIVPSYYYRPRLYIRVPSGYYPTPKSELFTMDNFGGGYLSNLLPTFDKETPNAKVDPVPNTLPSIPSTSDTGVGVDPARLNNFPFWNQQASNWVWPDGISTGSLPFAEVVQVKPQNNLLQLPQTRDQNQIQAQHPAPSDGTDMPLLDTLALDANQVV